MILVVTSPDVLSIGMFFDYVHKYHLPSSIFVNLNGLLSDEFLSGIVDETLKRHPAGSDIVFKHKTRRKLIPERLPKNLIEKADCIVGFDLYSTHAVVVKSFQGWTDSVVSSYHAYIEKQNAAG
jgi:hypothetical protein